jgi:hypothetical protein
MNTITFLKHDDEQRDKFMSFYHSENRLVIEEQDDLFYKTFKAYNVKGIV